ncbi:MAG: FAD-binding oxidoreductase [Nitratireductor sp.]
MRHLYEPAAYRPEVNSYWQTTASPLRWPELKADRTADTLIIGGGYTGLNCALELAELGHDPQSIVILEARQPGWGASGRNGGFCCIGGSKLPVDKQLARFGEAETVRYFKEQCASIDRFVKT